VASAVLKPAQLRELSVAELKEKVRAMEEELFNLRFQAHTGQLSNPLRMRMVRRDIARARTIMREKGNGSATAVKAKAQG
jgi:large subunit ribosomal protein L29